jgi:G:T/U-mismatch repair DNA glycosylase
LSQIPDCQSIIVTGQKAAEIISTIVHEEPPTVGGYIETRFQKRHLRIYRMPSSSRAYPKPVEEKAEAYKKMFAGIHILNSPK